MRLILKNYSLNIFLNIFLFLQFVLIYLIVNSTVSKLLYDHQINNYIVSSHEDMALLSGATEYNVKFGDSKEFFSFVKKLEEIEGITGVGYSIQESTIVDKFPELLIKTFYVNKTLSAVKLPLVSGNWFSDEGGNKSEIIIGGDISRKYQVGDKITIRRVYYENGGIAYKTIESTVIGILKKPVFYMDLGYQSTYPIFKNLFTDSQNIIYTTDPEIIDYSMLQYPLSSLLITAQNEEYFNSLKQYGQVHSFNEIQSNSSEELVYEIKDRIPLISFLFLTILFGLIGTLYLFVHKAMKVLSIYYLCGMTPPKIKYNVFVTNSLSIGMGGIVAFIISFIPSINEFIYGRANMGWWNLIISVVIFFISILTMIAFSSLLIRKNPIEIIRRFD